MEKQRTFDGELVPTTRLADDMVICADGTELRHAEVYYDVNGGAHPNNDTRHEAEINLVRDVFASLEQWVSEYTDGSHNNDYGDGYDYIVNETSHDWNNRIREWLDVNESDDFDFDDKFIAEMIDDIDDWESEYSPNEYSCYSGPGCCLYSLDIGEYEEQVDLDCFDVLKELHELGRLEQICDDLSREFCIHQKSRWDPATRTRIQEGYVHGRTEHPYLYLYFLPGGQWHYVVSEDTMRDTIERIREQP